MTLAEKIEESYSILQYAFDNWGNSLAVAFSGGKDSLVVLHLIRYLCDGEVTIPVFNIDTSVKFPEVLRFRDHISALWNLNLIILSNKEIIGKIKIGVDKQACCQSLKIQPLKQAIEAHGIKGLITAIRWDEHEIRTCETHISTRENPAHTRIHPILHFTETDVWDYIHAFHLPYCELYDQGYRSLSCIPCTEKGDPEMRERQGRSPEKEKIMEDLRLLGYF